jgi:HSP20 family molecular chaperone IbpA
LPIRPYLLTEGGTSNELRATRMGRVSLVSSSQSEREFGSFERCFRHPDGIDTDKMEATLKKGVLTVTVPKAAGAQEAAKKIAIMEA